MRRTITLPDSEGAGGGPRTGSLQVDQLERITADTSFPARTHPDTLEVIHRPDPPVAPAPARPAEVTGPPPRSADEELASLLAGFRDERRRRRSVRGGKLLITVLAAALLGVWSLHPPRTGGEENRATTSFPTLSPSGLVSGANARQADAALRDRLALRRYVVKTVGETSRDRLGTSLNPEVVLGAGGVPFLTEDFTLPCEGDFEPAQVDAGLRELRALGATTGKTITVAIAPDKSAVLTSELGARGSSLMACSNRVREATQATWGHESTPPVLTVWNQMAAAAKGDPDQIFQHGDSHWTSQGALVWSRALISQLIAQGEAPASLAGAPVAVRGKDQPADGDLYRLMGITKAETVPDWKVTRRGVKVTAKSLPSPSGHDIAIFQASSATQPLITGRTLVINDSFIARAEGQLAPYFSNLEVLHWADFLTDVQDGTVPHFDRIILETVQRGWPERAALLEAGQPVHDALADELSAASRTAPLRAPTPLAAS